MVPFSSYSVAHLQDGNRPPDFRLFAPLFTVGRGVISSAIAWGLSRNAGTPEVPPLKRLTTPTSVYSQTPEELWLSSLYCNSLESLMMHDHPSPKNLGRILV